MKKWHLGGFFGCLIGGIVLLCAMSYMGAVFMSVLSSPLTGTETLMVGALLFLLIAVAGLLTGLVCQGNCIDTLPVFLYTATSSQSLPLCQSLSVTTDVSGYQRTWMT